MKKKVLIQFDYWHNRKEQNPSESYHDESGFGNGACHPLNLISSYFESKKNQNGVWGQWQLFLSLLWWNSLTLHKILYSELHSVYHRSCILSVQRSFLMSHIWCFMTFILSIVRENINTKDRKIENRGIVYFRQQTWYQLSTSWKLQKWLFLHTR